MEIKLVTGATAYEAAVNSIKQINPANLGEKNLVVVPDSFSMQAESLIFDVLNIKSTFNIEVVGISRLASKIMRNENFDFQRISALEEIFNIYKAVKICELSFVYFNKCNIDYCIKILQIIKQFKACKIKPQQIKPVGDDLLDKKMTDLKNIYVIYESMLGEKVDLSGLLEVFSDNADKFTELQSINLFFVNFDSFSMEINSFICKLAKYVNKIVVGYAKPISVTNAFIYEDDILKKTSEYAKEYNLVVPVENFPTSLKDEHLALAKNLFSFSIEEGHSDFFQNIVAINKLDEIEFVAKYIKSKIVSGAKYNEFAVAVADDGYYADIKNIFQNYDLTFYCDEAVDLTNTILGRFLTKILSISKFGFSKENIKYIVSSPLFEVENKSEILSAIDFYVLDNKEDFLSKFPEFERLFCEIQNLKLCFTVSTFGTTLLNFVEKYKANYEKTIEELKKKNLFKIESENSQSWELVQQVFEKLSSIGGEEKIEFEDFENLLSLALKSVKVETIPAYIDAIFVGNATTSYFSDVKTLIVLGATANALPKMQSDIGIIDDDDIRKLKLNYALEPEIKVLNRRSRLKIFEMLQHAQKKLIVCTPLNENGKQAQQAGFVSDLQKMFGKNVVHTIAIEDFNNVNFTSEEAVENLLMYLGNKQNVLKSLIRLKQIDRVPYGMLRTLSEFACGKVEEENKNLECDKEKLSNFLIKKGRISASQLETYFHCPYRHLIQYGLKIKQNETIEPNQRLFGVFEHAMLEKFVSENPNLKKYTEKDIDEFLDKNLNKILEEVFDSQVLNEKYYLHFLRHESKLIIKNVIKEQKHSDFVPYLFEKSVSKQITEDVKLVGYIDRVDKCKNYFRILDYKTGKVDEILKDLYYGNKLQLFLYASCIKESTNFDCAGVYYFDCKTKYTKKDAKTTLLKGLTKKDEEVVLFSDDRLWEENFRSDLIGMTRKKDDNVKQNEFPFKYGKPEENFDKLFDYSVKVSQKAIEQIKHGYIEMKPKEKACESCPYLSICKYDLENGFRKMKSLKNKK